MSSLSSLFNKFTNKEKRKKRSTTHPSLSHSTDQSPRPSLQLTLDQASSSSQPASNRQDPLLTPVASTSSAAVSVAQTAPTGTAAALATSALNLAAVTTQTPRLGSTGPDRGIARSDVTKGLAIFRTLLNVAEKVVDGLPVWGPKAGVATASEVLKSIQVREHYFLPYYVSSSLHRTRLRTMPQSTTYAGTSSKCS
jgi:hypothetical protein